MKIDGFVESVIVSPYFSETCGVGETLIGKPCNGSYVYDPEDTMALVGRIMIELSQHHDIHIQFYYEEE